ncbi:MAG: aspartate aminotransferase family protein [Rhizobiaceae bacterium]
MTSHDVRQLLGNACDRASNYLETLGDRPVGPKLEDVETLKHKLQGPLPLEGSAPGDVLAFLDTFGSPATVASAGGRYFGFVTGGSLPAALAANVLAGAWDQNSFSWISSPAAAAFEDTSLRWLKEALGLPENTEGALTTGATMAHFACLAAARYRVLQQKGWNVDADGLFGAPEVQVVVGDEVHSSLLKVLSMLGLGRNRVHRLPTDAQGRAVASELPSISGPAIVCLQAGNVNSGAFDDAVPIIRWARSVGAWVHVDGAFGLWALASREREDLAAAFREADSWAFDAHKWLNVPYDSGIALLRDAEALAAAMSQTGAYLLPSGARDAMNFTPDSSRRARGVEIWASLKSLGREGLAELVDRNCAQARNLAEGLEKMGAEVLNEVVLNQVIVAFGDEKTTRRVIENVQTGGACWCGGTEWKGRAAMRISVSSWATTGNDIAITIEAIAKAYVAAADQG